MILVPPVFRKNRIAFYRLVRGIDQEDLARSLGVSRRTLSNWEMDNCLPTREHAERASKVLRIPLRKLWPFESW